MIKLVFRKIERFRVVALSALSFVFIIMIKRVFRKVRQFRVVVITALSFVVIILFLRWVYITNDQSTMLLWLAILLAALTAIINALSLDLTRQSLDLTRQSLDLNIRSTRPFFSLTDVRYSPGGQTDNPRILFNLCNTGSLPAHRIEIEFELSFDNKLAHGRRKEATLKPNESREVIFPLPLDIREMIPTKKSDLTIRTEFFPNIVGTSFYHTDRHYSIPPHIKTLDESFDFIFRSGGAFD